jgi:hypothetical protein
MATDCSISRFGFVMARVRTGLEVTDRILDATHIRNMTIRIRRTAMADFCRAFATRHRGATARTMALIEQLIPVASP